MGGRGGRSLASGLEIAIHIAIVFTEDLETDGIGWSLDGARNSADVPAPDVLVPEDDRVVAARVIELDELEGIRRVAGGPMNGTKEGAVGAVNALDRRPSNGLR